MNNSACNADWLGKGTGSVNWKDCVHRWKRSRDKWRSEAASLRNQLCEMVNSAQHWSRQAGIAQSELVQTRNNLNSWRDDAFRNKESARQWKAQAISWREEARRWKQGCSELMERKDNRQIALLCQARQNQSAEMLRQPFCK